MMVFSAIPFYLIGLVLIYFLAASTGWFPLSGGYGIVTIPEWSWDFALEILHHSTLPALSIIIASIGTWAIGMRGMMVTVEGEDYMTFAEAKGLKPGRLFFSYGMRTAILPQVTALALYFGQIVTGAVWSRSSSPIRASVRCCSIRSSSTTTRRSTASCSS